MANIIIKIGKGIEVAAEDVIKWARMLQNDAASPTVLAALAILAVGIERCAADVSADAMNPLNLLLTGTVQVADFMAIWPEVRNFLRTLGVAKI